MIVETSRIRDIYPQTGSFSFALSIELPNTTGQFDFGFSGANGMLNYRFKNGRIFDNRLRFIGAYEPGERVSLSGVISPTTYDVYINEQPRVFGTSRELGYFNAVYVKPQNVSPDIDLFINGEVPSYELSDTVVFQTGEAVAVTGYIKNLSAMPFRLFSGDYLGDTTAFSLASLQTGAITNSGAIIFSGFGETAGGLTNLPLVLYTDFGSLNLTLPVSGDNTPPPTYFIDVAGGTSFTNNDSPSTFVVQFGDPNGSLEIVPWLKHVSGSGISYKPVTITSTYTGGVSGNLTGSGWLFGVVRQTGFSAFASGVIDTVVSGFHVATGTIFQDIDVLMTGQVTGIGYSGAATGILKQAVVAVTTDGFHRFSGIATGTPLDYYTLTPTSNQRATGYFDLNGIQNEDLFWIGNEVEALVYPHSFTTAQSLVQYLNENTHIHQVTATYNTNRVFLTSIYENHIGNGTILKADQCNQGSAQFSNQFLTGGHIIYGHNYTVVSGFSGGYDQTLLKTGAFTYPFSGEVSGTASGISQIKELSGVWSFKSGLTSAQTSMREMTYNPLGYFSGAVLSGSQRTIYIQIGYSNNQDSVVDVADFMISGRNQPTGVTLRITGTP